MYRTPLPPVASVADFAQAQATARQARAASLNSFTTGASMLTLNVSIAPASATIFAAGLVTPKASGLFMVSFAIVFALAAAATVSAEAIVAPATGLSGGTAIGSTFRYLSGGFVAIAGEGTPTGAVLIGNQVATAQIAAQTITFSQMFAATPGVQNVIAAAVQSAGTLDNTTMSMSYYELP